MLHESAVLLAGVFVGFVNKERLIKLNVSLLFVCSVMLEKKSFLCFHNYPLEGPTCREHSIYRAPSPGLLLDRPA